MIAIDDPHLPGLADLGPEALRRITGSENVSLMRFRYRAGKRAILHLATEAGEGSVWFFEGDKARKLARRSTTPARFDAPSAALFEAFPYDHRMPQIRAFLQDYRLIAPRLIGARPLGAPEVLRYRPGLSCTFRCRMVGGGAAYVKLLRDECATRLAVMNRQMAAHLAGGPLSVAPVLGTDAELNAIAYAAAMGRPLDAELSASGGVGAVQQAITALRRFWSLPRTPARHLTVEALLERGAECADLASVTVPGAGPGMRRVLARLEAGRPRLAARPIHADIKLEHLFIEGAHTTLIDTESVSLGPPDYDLAQLCGRLWQAEIEGQLPRDLVERAAELVRENAGDNFDWCLGVVALRLAKFHAQRPSPDAGTKIASILERLS